MSGGLILCPSDMSSTDVPLTFELSVLSGSTDLVDIEFWLEDEAGTVFSVGASMSTSTADGPTLLMTSTFLLPREMTALTLHFATGEVIDLSEVLGRL